MLIYTIAVDLDELLEDGCLAAITSLRELCRVVIMAIYLAFVLVVAILSAKDSRTNRTGEVVDVVFAIEGCDVGSAEGATAFEADQIQAFEVVGLAKGVLVGRVIGYREEFGSNDFPAVLIVVVSMS